MQLKKFLSFEQKKVLVNSFILCNFDYCPLEWVISSAKCLKKSWKFTKTCPLIFTEWPSQLNPVFLREIFYFKESNRPVSNKYKLNLQIPKINQVTSGIERLRGLGPKIWNTLPYHIEKPENIAIFKKTTKNWNGVESKYLVCQKLK